MNVAQRQKLEKMVISNLVRRALNWGYMISVHDGEDYALCRSKSHTKIMNSLMSTDMDTLILRNEYGTRVGSVQCVYGNDGYDVIADYSWPVAEGHMNALLDPTNEYANTLDKR